MRLRRPSIASFAHAAHVAHVAVLLLPWTLAGCTGFRPTPPEPDEVMGDDVPAAWTAPGAATLGQAASGAGPWWIAFGDPELTALIEEALAGSPDLDAAVARLDAARARARIAGADLWPQVDGSFSAARSRRNFIGFPIFDSEGGGDERVLSTTNTSYGVSLDVSWEADLWGRVRAGREAARVRSEAAEADLAGAALSLAGQTAKSWFGVVEAREQAAFAAATVATLTKTTGWVRRRYEAGVREPLDLRLARSDEAVARAELAGRGQTLDALERQLEALIGRYPDRAIGADGTTGALGTPPAPIPAGLPSEIVTRRPDLAADEARLDAAGFDVAAARAALYPRIALTGSYGRSSERLEDLLDNDFTVWSIAGNLLQPIFQGGRLRANVDLSEASFEEATALYAGDVLDAFREVETALAADAFLAARVEALDVAAKEAEAALDLARNRYRLGLQDFLTVLEAQRRVYDAQSGLLQVKRARLDARVDLILALGGGWER